MADSWDSVAHSIKDQAFSLLHYCRKSVGRNRQHEPAQQEELALPADALAAIEDLQSKISAIDAGLVRIVKALQE